MSLQVKSRAPNFRLVFHLKAVEGLTSGRVIDSSASTDSFGRALRRSVVSITTQRRLGQAGTFEIALLPDAIGAWQDTISPMDLVEIYMSSTPTYAGGAIPIRFRGFVDSVTYGFSLIGGVPRPSIIIAGRDFTKILIEQRFYTMGNTMPFLVPINAFVEALAALNPDSQANTVRAAISASPANPPTTEINKATNPSAAGLTPDVVITTLWNDVAVKFFDAIFTNLGVTLNGRVALDVSLAQMDAAALLLQAVSPPVLSDNYDVISTRIWQIMTEYSNAPFYELFFEDYDDAQYLVFRPAPWRDAHGNFVAAVTYTRPLIPSPNSAYAANHGPALIPISSDEIEAITLARADAYGAVANFFTTYASVFEALTWAEARITSGSGLTTTSNPSILGDPRQFNTPATTTSDWHNFGFRPLDISTRYVPLPQPDSKAALTAAEQTALSIGAALNNRLTAAFSYGEFLESGTITLIRDPVKDSANPIRIGDYIEIAPSLSYAFGPDIAAPGTSSAFLAYVELVSYEMIVPMNQTDGSYRVRLGVTRGEGYLKRHPEARDLAPKITISVPQNFSAAASPTASPIPMPTPTPAPG
jgi:hypothetical protein